MAKKTKRRPARAVKVARATVNTKTDSPSKRDAKKVNARSAAGRPAAKASDTAAAVTAELERHYDSKYGKIARREASEAAVLSVDGLDVWLRIWEPLTENERKIAIQFYRMGFEDGYLKVAKKTQAARKSGTGASVGSRKRSANSRYAEIVAYHATTQGTETQREEATATRFRVTDRTVRRAIKEVKQ